MSFLGKLCSRWAVTVFIYSAHVDKNSKPYNECNHDNKQIAARKFKTVRNHPGDTPKKPFILPQKVGLNLFHRELRTFCARLDYVHSKKRSIFWRWDPHFIYLFADYVCRRQTLKRIQNCN